MKKTILTAALLAAMLLTGCTGASSNSTNAGQTPVLSGSPAQDSDPTADADSAYFAYLRTFSTLDKSTYKALFNADEKAAAAKVSAATLGLDEDIYKVYLERVNRYDEWVDAYFETLQKSMLNVGSVSSTWKPTIGEKIEVPEATVQALAQETGLNIEEAVRFDMFALKDMNNNGNTSVSGKTAGVVKIDGKWYPSVIFEMAPLPEE